VQLATSTLSATVGSTTVRELPLNGRDWTALALFNPRRVVRSQQTPNFSGFGPTRRRVEEWQGRPVAAVQRQFANVVEPTVALSVDVAIAREALRR